MIPSFDYRPEYERMRDEIDAAMRRVLESGRLILGPEVEAFEREFAAATGAAHGVGVASGTDAISLALRACGIGEGDEVVTVANAGAPPPAGVLASGARPVFADVDPQTLALDVGSAEAALSPRTRALLVVHLYGRPVHPGPILDLARRRGLTVIEDCAHAHGARVGGRHVGADGAVGCFSFYPTKILGAYGDGGICVTSDPAIAGRLRRLRMYGYDDAGSAEIPAVNSRLDELQAAILRVKLARLEQTLAERRRLAARYAERLAGSPYVLDRPPVAVDHAYHLFVVRCRDRARAVRGLEAAGIGYGLHYPLPAHRMGAFRVSGTPPAPLPVTERACDQVLSLPLYPGLPEEAVDRVAEALLDAA